MGIYREGYGLRIILGLHKDNRKEHGSYYSIIGYRYKYVVNIF